MSEQQGFDDVRELNYEGREPREHNYEDNGEVLQESDVERFREENRNSVLSTKSDETIEVMQHDNHNEELHSPQKEQYVPPPRAESPVREVEIPAKPARYSPDENDNHRGAVQSKPSLDDEDMGSAKRAAQAYKEALHKQEAAAKEQEDAAERAELVKKKKVSDLISRFNSGEAFNEQGKSGTSTYKNEYGVGKVGTVSTGRFQ